VSGFLLKQRFKRVFGIHFTTGYERVPADLHRLEEQLGFPVTDIDLGRVFEEKVVQYFSDTYLGGKTPNPCVVCNQKIKFGELLKHALDMGADYLATGHYAGIVNPISFPDNHISHSYLEKGEDGLKDQSYFLARLSPEQLERIIFPLAGLTKETVKKIAESAGITPIHPSESQDICFIHDNDFAGFIMQKNKGAPRPGDIVDMNRRIVGRHNGLHQFTIGQRRGIDCPAAEPYYVKKIDMKNNTLQVCFKRDLAQKRVCVDQVNWNFPDGKIFPELMTQIRYSHKGAKSTLFLNGSRGEVVFDQPQNAVTPGQIAVFYQGARVLGAGIIQ
jgi:tRNA-specific 2-thiouridylase